MLVSPRRNHSSSANTERVCTFLVVTSGKPAVRSKGIWCPNTLRVPVPVRSLLAAPSSRMRWRRSRYCRTDVSLVAQEGLARHGPGRVAAAVRGSGVVVEDDGVAGGVRLAGEHIPLL